MRSATIDLRQFVASLPKGQAQTAEIEAAVAELAQKSALVVSAEGGKPRAVTLPDFHLVALAELYRQLTMDDSRPFPKEDTAPVPIPEGQLTTADLKSQIGTLLEPVEPDTKGIIRLLFPEGVDSLIVPRKSTATDLVEAAVVRISRYLQSGKNQGFAESKLVSVLRGSEMLVRQTLEDVAQRPKKAAAMVLAPTDFSFRFWTHLSNLILQDFRSKSEKTEQDQAACQSACIIGYAVFHKKGAVQRERELVEDRKNIEAAVRKPPFVFGFQDLYALKDEKGATYVSKHGQDFIHAFLREKTARSGDETIPYLVRVHAAAQKKDYYLHRDLLVPVFLKKLAEASEEVRKLYLDEWVEQMRQERTPPASKSDAVFRRDVEARVRNGYPLLSALANGALLYVAGEDAKTPDAAKAELRKCFAVENILRPFDELLGLSRAQLLKDARVFLPFWMTVPLLGGILRLFRRMFSGRKAEPSIEPPETRPAPKDAPAGPEPVQPAPVQTAKVVQYTAGGEAAKKRRDKDMVLRYKRGIQSLMTQFVPKGSTLNASLAELAERWNPLYAAEQKKNLVEDVNALVRDFLRPIKRSFLTQPPDAKRIHALAEQLSTSQSLSKIKKREPLLRYIELYMIGCLQIKQ